MRLIPRGLAMMLVSVWAVLVLGGTAFAAGTAPDTVTEKAAPRLSPGMEQLLNDIRTLRRTRLEQLNAEIDQMIERAHQSGKITDEEAARLREWRAVRRLGLSPHDSEAEVKAKLDEAVKNGRLTREQAKKILKEWEKARRSHRKARP